MFFHTSQQSSIVMRREDNDMRPGWYMPGVDGGSCPGHWISRYDTKWLILCWCATAIWSRPPSLTLPTDTTLHETDSKLSDLWWRWWTGTVGGREREGERERERERERIDYLWALGRKARCVLQQFTLLRCRKQALRVKPSQSTYSIHIFGLVYSLSLNGLGQ